MGLWEVWYCKVRLFFRLILVFEGVRVILVVFVKRSEVFEWLGRKRIE